MEEKDFELFIKLVKELDDHIEKAYQIADKLLSLKDELLDCLHCEHVII
jgi:hypothetical protein